MFPNALACQGPPYCSTTVPALPTSDVWAGSGTDSRGFYRAFQKGSRKNLQLYLRVRKGASLSYVSWRFKVYRKPDDAGKRESTLASLLLTFLGHEAMEREPSFQSEALITGFGASHLVSQFVNTRGCFRPSTGGKINTQ